ncbi:MAG TPA: YoaK family protein [Xanthobacteraceae bacterium]|jgi:uncharacterized membrane protein YoaK (UPF0700 family)|nr:YoaK family protein [Xanthobacteraceae bacterium]
MTEPESRSERVGLADLGLGLMVIAAGSSDALAYLALGNVFTSAMTGNTVLLCIALGQGRMVAALQSFAALAAFIVGAVMAAALARRPEPREYVPRLMPLFLLEIVFLAVFVVVWFATDRASESARYALIVLSALAMGVQGVAARQINVPQVNTIVFTTTIISVVTACTQALLRASGLPFATKRQIGMLLVYAAGAVLMAVLIAHESGTYVWLPLIAVIGAFACYEVAHRAGRRSV